MHQTFCCILRDIYEGFLYSLEGIKQWDWSQVSATCPKSHFDCTDTSTCPWGLKPLFWIFLVVFITLSKSSVISSDQMSLNGPLYIDQMSLNGPLYMDQRYHYVRPSLRSNHNENMLLLLEGHFW